MSQLYIPGPAKITSFDSNDVIEIERDGGSKFGYVGDLLDGRYDPLTDSLRIPAPQPGAITGSPSYTVLSFRQYGWAFDASADEGVVFPLITLPSHWTTVDIDIEWVNVTADAGDVRWSTRWSPLAVGDDLSSTDAGTDSPINVTAGSQHILTVSEVRSTVSVDPTKYFRLGVYRVGTNVADTKAGDAGLIAVNIRSV